jgi:hypothetical protein
MRQPLTMVVYDGVCRSSLGHNMTLVCFFFSFALLCL